MGLPASPMVVLQPARLRTAVVTSKTRLIKAELTPGDRPLLLDVAQASIGFENRFCYSGSEATTTRMRADTKALTRIACLVESAQAR